MIDNSSVSSSADIRSSYLQAKWGKQKKAKLLARTASFQEKKEMKETQLQLKLEKEELDIKTALKICEMRTK